MERIDYYPVLPEAFDQLRALGQKIGSAGIDPRLRALVELRVSQINGCVYCVDMHSKQARQHGETQQRLDTLVTWHEAPFFNERERAALGWAESLTNISTSHAADADYEALKKHFSEREIVALSLIISVMNTWNRIALGFRQMPE